MTSKTKKDSNVSLRPLMENLGYPFQSDTWIKMALRHSSCGINNNERLEFLGDAILSFIISDELFQRFPDATEGDLTRLRSHLVKEETLIQLAQELKIEKYICLGKSERRNGIKHASTLADCVEALIGAIYRDSQDIAICRQSVLRWYHDLLRHLSLENLHQDPKSKLQELLQEQHLPLPQYRIIKTQGAEHEKTFTVEGQVVLLKKPVIGTSNSRRKAEQAVATRILEELEHAK